MWEHSGLLSNLKTSSKLTESWRILFTVAISVE